MWIRHDHKIFWILLLLGAGVIVINGATSQVSLGDESHHFRFAQNIYDTGKRAPFDPLYESGNPPGFFNNDPPLWHFGLVFLWKITGGISQTIAQFYHILFLILLLWITALLAEEFTGKEEGGMALSINHCNSAHGRKLQYAPLYGHSHDCPRHSQFLFYSEETVY